MKTKNLISILSIVALSIGVAISGYSQSTTSGSFGSTFVHHDAEMVFHGYHNFQVGSLQALPGIIGTERQFPRGYVGFTNSSQVSGANNESHIDGYVRFHGEGTMWLPIGDNGIYAPLRTEQKSGVLGACYYNADVSVAVTTKLNGENYGPLPEHGPFNTENRGSDISIISDFEYWHIEGDAEAKITLAYNINSRLDDLVNGIPANLSIVGWDGSSWEIISSNIVSSTLGESLNEGSIVTNDYIDPSQYSIITFGALGDQGATPGSIGGITWGDINGDGIRQANEPVIPGVKIHVEDCDMGNEILVIESDVAGKYNFVNLEDGTYILRVNIDELGTNSEISMLPETNETAVYNDFKKNGTTVCIEIKYGSIHSDIDLGIVSLSLIGDQVWYDLNQNGLKDNSEPGIADVEINLMQDDLAIATTHSDGSGAYKFKNVYPGLYHLQVNHSSQLDFTKYSPDNPHRNSDVDHSNGVGSSYIFKVNSGEEKLDLDIGLTNCNLLSDFVWIDRDENNLYNEGDSRKSNVEVNLYKSSAEGYILYSSTITDSDGQYEFCVSSGSYYLHFVKPYGLYEFVLPHIGDNENIDSDVDGTFGEGTTSSFKVDPNESINGIGAGFNSEDHIGTMVWLDQNRDGVRQITEPGIPGINVNLYNSDHNLVTSQISNDDGRTTFTKVEPGAYYLRIPEKGEHEFTSAFSGTDDSKDSNFDESNGRNSSATFQVVKGSSNQHIDAGFMNEECLFSPLAYDLRMGSRGIEVIWETGPEDLISHYVVEKQSGTGDFIEMKSIKTRGNAHQIYGYTDLDYEQGQTHSFRIIAYKLDGEVCISEIKTINAPEVNVVLEIYNINEELKNTNIEDPCDIASTKVYHNKNKGLPLINWESDQEAEIAMFILQRKLRFRDKFVNIDTIYSNQSGNHLHATKDETNLSEGTYEYRLLTIDRDGYECVSNIVTVKIGEKSLPPFTLFDKDELPEMPELPELPELTNPIKPDKKTYEVLIYPNPAVDRTNLLIQVGSPSSIKVNIYDSQGRKVLGDVITGKVEDGSGIFDIPLHGLEEGVYFISTELENKVVVRKLVVQSSIFGR